MIEFRGVSKRFDDGTLAVDDFSLVIPSHKATVLVGSSGCGKTTLLRMINRMVEPTVGQVLIDDVDVAQRDRVALRRSIGYVLQAGGAHLLQPAHPPAGKVRREAAGSGVVVQQLGARPGPQGAQQQQPAGPRRGQAGFAAPVHVQPFVLGIVADVQARSIN